MPYLPWRLSLEPLEPRLPLAAGDLDLTFHGDGLLEQSFPSSYNSNDSVVESILDHEGRFLVAGQSFGGKGRVAAVSRFQADGKLDTTFGTNGTVAVPLGNGTDLLKDIAVQSDGKIILVGRAHGVNLNSNSHAVLARINPDGTLDQSFGPAGRTVREYGGHSAAHAVAVAPDDQFVVLGTGFGDLVIAKYLADGTRDQSFGDIGTIRIRVHDRAEAQDIVLAPDGKIIVAFTEPAINSQIDLVTMRLLADGSIDESFGMNGRTVIPGIVRDSFKEVSRARLLFDREGNVLVASTSYLDRNGSFTVARLKGDGLLDDSFGNDGVVEIGFQDGSFTALQTIAEKSDGTIVLSGFGEPYIYTAIYLRPNGEVLEGGEFTLADTRYYSADSDHGGLVVLPEGKLVASFSANIHRQFAGDDIFLIGFNSDGSLDSSFGLQGITSENLVDFYSRSAANSIHQLGNGGLLGLITRTQVNDSLEPVALLQRFHHDGSLDTSYGIAGSLKLPFSPTQMIGGLTPRIFEGRDANYVLIQEDSHLRITRLTPEGEIDNSFATDGWLSFEHRPYMFYVDDVDESPTGDFIVAGRSDSSSHYVFLALQANGTLDLTYGEEGLVQVPKHHAAGDGAQVCLQADGAMVTLLANTSDSGMFRIVLNRFDIHGVPDSSFGAEGIVDARISTGVWADRFRRVACLADGAILVLGTASNEGRTPIQLTRFERDGQPDLMFGPNGTGTVRLPVMPTTHEPRSLLVTEDGRIVISAVIEQNKDSQTIVFRLNPDGRLDQSFGNRGEAQYSLGPYSNSLDELSAGQNGDILAAGWRQTVADIHSLLLRMDGGTPFPNPWQNPGIALDVNNDGSISPQDALVIINDLNASAARVLKLYRPQGDPYIDPNGDRLVSPVDALVIINELNRNPPGEIAMSPAMAWTVAAFSSTNPASSPIDPSDSQREYSDDDTIELWSNDWPAVRFEKAIRELADLPETSQANDPTPDALFGTSDELIGLQLLA